MTEHELTAEVIKLCDELKLLWHHCPNSSRCQGPKGLPDLIIVGEYVVIFAELKSEDGENSAEQDLWHWTLGRITRRRYENQLVSLQWRPSNLETGITIRDWLHLAATGERRK